LPDNQIYSRHDKHSRPNKFTLIVSCKLFKSIWTAYSEWVLRWSWLWVAYFARSPLRSRSDDLPLHSTWYFESRSPLRSAKVGFRSAPLPLRSHALALTRFTVIYLACNSVA